MGISKIMAAVAFCVAPAAAMYASAPARPSTARPATPVVLDPGHGGDDFGAIIKGAREKDIVLAVALKLRNRLKKDLPVVLTRENDAYVTLDDRVVRSVDWNGAVFVSIHVNKVPNKKTAGATVYSFGPEKRRPWRRRLSHPKVPPMPAPPRLEIRESDLFASAVAKALRAGGVRVEKATSDYYVLKNPSQPSVLIELGYLSNPEEASRLNSPAYQEKLAEALAKAIARYAQARSLRAETAAAAPRPASRL